MSMRAIASLTVCAAAFAGVCQAQVNLTAETASPGGPAHFSISHLAQVSAEADVADLQVLEGQTLTNSLLNVANGNSDIAAVPLILPFLMSRNLGPYAGLDEGAGAKLVQNVRLLYPYNFGGHGLWGYATSGITSYGELEGKTVLNGPPQGGALTSARQYLTAITGLEEGQGYNGVQVNWGQMATATMDGTADMNLLPMSFPDPDVTAAASAGSVVIVSMPKETWESEDFQRLASSPGRSPILLSEGALGYGANESVSLVSSDGNFRSIAIGAADIVRADLDEELVYAMVTEYAKTVEELKSRAPFLRSSGIGILDEALTPVCGPNPLKYHLGAVRAWEDAGFTIPECAKP